MIFNDNKIYSTAYDGRFHIYDMIKQKVISKYQTINFINKLKFNSYYKCLALSDFKGNFLIHDLRNQLKNDGELVFNLKSKVNFILSKKRTFYVFSDRKGFIFDIRKKSIKIEKKYQENFNAGLFLNKKEILVADKNFSILDCKKLMI